MGIALTPTETHDAIAATADALFAAHYDFARRRAAIASGGHSPAVWTLLADAGLLGTEADEASGGIAGTFADTAVVLQAFGRALVVEPFVPTVVIGVGLINALAAPAQRAALLGPVVAGAAKLALVYDPDAPGAMTARRDGDGWHLHGRVAGVLGGNVADLLLVAAATDDAMTLFAVEARHDGCARAGYALYDASGAADVTLDVTVADPARLGPAGGAGAALDLAVDRGAAATIHEAVGAMAWLCAATPEYLTARVQFGQPLARFQVLQHRMVDMGIALEEARSMALVATAALDAPDPAVRARDISAAKVHLATAARLVGQTAVQLHGGIALTDDFPAGHYFKRLTLLARQFGDELHHLDRFVALTTVSRDLPSRDP